MSQSVTDTRIISLPLDTIRSTDLPLFSRIYWLFFILGSIAGTAYTYLINNPVQFVPGESFTEILSAAMLPLILAVFFSTSVIGYYILPVIFVSEGFIVSRITSFAAGSPISPVRSFAVNGLPLFLSVCAIFIAAPGLFAYAKHIRSGDINSTDISTVPVGLSFMLVFSSALAQFLLNSAFR